MSTSTVTFTVRMPAEVAAALDERAKVEARSRNWLVTRGAEMVLAATSPLSPRFQVPDPAHAVKDGPYPREVEAAGQVRASESREAIAGGAAPLVVDVIAMPRGSKYHVSIPAYGKSGMARSKDVVEDVANSLLSDEPGAFELSVRWG